ncbi:hypothetical protein ACIO14_21090 [Nocardia fluminea]|uniref:hypothetical protein n=1 Tax=Nocardia fluminea TaxID=134984 RepID=UPI0037F5AFF1
MATWLVPAAAIGLALIMVGAMITHAPRRMAERGGDRGAAVVGSFRRGGTNRPASLLNRAAMSGSVR